MGAGAVAAAVVGTAIGIGAHEQHQANKAQKTAQKRQSRILDEQNKIMKQQQEADMAKRKEQIDQLREQVAGGNYSTNQTSEVGLIGGIRGKLG